MFNLTNEIKNMNVYFIDPTYVKSEAWKPLLTYLKVKGVYSFIPKNELPEVLVSIIKPHIKAAYSPSDIKKYSDNCVFWLRAHFEKHIHLITDDYEDHDEIPEEELKKYGTRSVYKNINNLDDNNCLVLLKLKTSYDFAGKLVPPRCEMEFIGYKDDYAFLLDWEKSYVLLTLLNDSELLWLKKPEFDKKYKKC